VLDTPLVVRAGTRACARLGAVERIVLIGADGSGLANRAASAGLALLGTPDRVVVATVVEDVDPALVTGTGFAGGVVSPETMTQLEEERRREGEEITASTAGALDADGVETRVVRGDPGHALCVLAAELPASVLVVGSRGRGGLTRALLGSVSDHVIRHAPCPVLVMRAESDPGTD
jgi:nucleotide-binding universal stress UspA family protein